MPTLYICNKIPFASVIRSHFYSQYWEGQLMANQILIAFLTVNTGVLRTNIYSNFTPSSPTIIFKCKKLSPFCRTIEMGNGHVRITFIFTILPFSLHFFQSICNVFYLMKCESQALNQIGMDILLTNSVSFLKSRKKEF